MSIQISQINVGKLHSRQPKWPSEPDYVESIRTQFKHLQLLLANAFKQVEDATPEILLDVLQPTFAKSQVYCPKLTHKLVNSGYLVITKFRGSPRVEMGYGRGGDPFYAAYVHERVDIPHRPPTRSKFLQAAMQEDIRYIRVRLEKRYRQLFGER